MPFFISWLLSIPVSYSRIFGRNFPEWEFGQMLDGDPEMPPTFTEGFWAFLNPIRNAILATFVWRTYSVLNVGDAAEKGAYLVFGSGDVMPRRIFTRFIMVKHGREPCRIITVDARGRELRYQVVARGSSDEVIDAAYIRLRDELIVAGRFGDDIARVLNGTAPSELYTFV